LVVADSLATARDAAELIVVDEEDLPAVGGIDEALAADAPLVWEDAGTNVLWRDHRVHGDVDGAFARADRVIRASLALHRQANAPLEPRGIRVDPGTATGELVCHAATQNPNLLRTTLARLLRRPLHSVHVVNGDIGGSFGQKAWVRHEDVAVAAAAVLLGRPVQWIEDRTENLLVGGHARDERLDVEAAVTDAGDVLAVRIRVTFDQGAYTVPMSARSGTANIIRTLFPSCYRIAALEFEGAVVATNRGPSVTYRGPWAAETWARERLLDLVARELRMDPWEVRRRNIWSDDELPTRMVTGPTISGLTVRDALDLVERHVDVAAFRSEQRAGRAEGRLLGLGVACFMEPAPGPPDFFPSVGGFEAPPELIRMRIELDGSVSVAIIQTSSGQGHETVVAQLVADALGVETERVRVVHGDTRIIPFDLFGTGGSRAAHKTSGAVQVAGELLTDRLRGIAAHLLEANVDDVELVDGAVGVVGSPDRRLTLAQLATVAWTTPGQLPSDLPPGLEVTASYTNRDCGWSQAVHCAIVEVDPETGSVAIRRFVVAEDCGRMINPTIVEGQVQGGVAQGIAGVLYEDVAYGPGCVPLSTTFADYLVPSAAEVPAVEILHVEPRGPGAQEYRGVGEGGAIGSPAALSNAIEDALEHLGVRVTEQYLPPERLFALLRSAAASECTDAPPAVL
jgi:carbon-monoxide dehydrogenase large subunit